MYILFCTIGMGEELMSVHICNLLSVYTFQKNVASWCNNAPRQINIVSYQVEGQYDHFFSAGVLQVKKDHIFTISPNDTYAVQQVMPGHSICVVFTSDNPIQTELIDCANDPRAAILFKKLLQYKNLNEESTYYMALSIAYEIVALIAEKRNMQYSQVAKNLPFVAVREHLVQNFSDAALNVKSLCAQYNFSDKYFREHFRALFGSTPTQYLIGLRLEEAARLLSSGTHSVSEVAEAVGFSDIYYFSRLFKKRFWCSPSRFRNSMP